MAHGWLGSRVVSVLDSGAERTGFKSQSRRCRVTVSGKLFTPIVPLFTKQQNLRVAGVTEAWWKVMAAPPQHPAGAGAVLDSAFREIWKSNVRMHLLTLPTYIRSMGQCNGRGSVRRSVPSIDSSRHRLHRLLFKGVYGSRRYRSVPAAAGALRSKRGQRHVESRWTKLNTNLFVKTEKLSL